MARRRKSGRLNVFLNSRLVGQLNREASGAIDFRYAPDWLSWEHCLPVSLSMPLREDRYIGEPVAAVFDNLLPDNAVIRRTVAERVGAEGVDPFSLLFALGQDCVGALQFLPEDIDPGPAGLIEGEELDDEMIGTIITNLARSPLGLEKDDTFRISIAGAQEKTALLRHKGKWLKPHGTTATTHILKPQIGQLPGGIDLTHSVENEFFCLTLTRAMGLPSAGVEIASFGGKDVLVVERFDRIFTPDGRLLRRPQEDCCQALSVPWTRKYENEGGPGVQQIMRLLLGSDSSLADRARFLKEIIVFWLLAATDGHAKNFSLHLSPQGGFALTPLYDVLSAQPSVEAKEISRNKLKLAMAVGDNRHYGVDKITARHFLQSAEKADLGREAVLGVIDDVLATGRQAVETTLAKLPALFPAAVAEPIAKGFLQRLEELERFRVGS